MDDFRCSLLNEIRSKFAELSPPALATFGRNKGDVYEAAVCPSESSKRYQQTVWNLLPRGSYFTPFRGVVTFRAFGDGSGLTWLGCEAVVPHERRGDFVEACYGLFTDETAIQGIELLRHMFCGIQDGTQTRSDVFGDKIIQWKIDGSANTVMSSVEQTLLEGKAFDLRAPKVGESFSARPRHECAGFGDSEWIAIAAAIGTIVVIGGAVIVVIARAIRH